MNKFIWVRSLQWKMESISFFILGSCNWHKTLNQVGIKINAISSGYALESFLGWPSQNRPRRHRYPFPRRKSQKISSHQYSEREIPSEISVALSTNENNRFVPYRRILFWKGEIFASF